MATTPENSDGEGPPNEIEATVLTVRSEGEAFELLQRALQSELTDQPYQLEFENWPILTVRFIGEGYDSTITPHIAEALVELQHAMNRSYARLVRHAPSANVLTKEERQSIEFKAKVDEGSSLFTIDMGSFADTLAKALVGKMTGTELVISIIGVALTAGGFLAYKAFLNARSEDKKVDLATQQTVQLSAQETQRLQIFADAMNSRPALKASHEDFDGARHDLLKSVGDATSFDMQGVMLTQDQAREIAKTPRTKAEDVQLNDTYRIERIDWSKEGEVRISLYATGAVQREFSASMRVHNLTPENKEKLKSCEWDGRPVYLSINATVLRGDVTSATIVGVEWPADPGAASPPQPPTA